MYVLLSLIGSSIDGLICGVLMQSMDVKCKKSDFFKFFAIIFSCCLMASCAGKLLSYTSLEKYVSYIGVFLMLCLAYSAFKTYKQNTDSSHSSNINLMAFSLAADACVVCVYLGMIGSNIFFTAVLSGILHCALIYVGQHLSAALLTPNLQKHSKLAAGFIFLFIALYKLSSIKI